MALSLARLGRRIVHLTVAASAVGAIGACSGSAQQGTCQDYEPLDFCPTGTLYVCDYTDEGCHVCGCVSTDPDEHLGPAPPD